MFLVHMVESFLSGLSWYIFGRSLASQVLPFAHRLLLLYAERSTFFFFVSSFPSYFYCSCKNYHHTRSPLSPAHQLRSNQQRSAGSCRAVLCGAVPCCVLYCCSTYYFVYARNHSKHNTRYRYCCARFVRTAFLNNKKSTSSSARPSNT